MKRLFGILVICLLAAGTLWARGYNLDESESVDLTGIEKIIITIESPRCIACLKTIRHDISIEGGERNSRLSISLNGEIRSNRRKAVPALLMDRDRDVLRISLYPENLVVMGLVSGGKVTFKVDIPSGFGGKVEVDVDSENLTMKDLSVEDLAVRIGSGNLRMGDIFVKERGTFILSSGECDGERLSGGELDIRSSSGNVDIQDIISGGNLYLEASSGKIECSSMKGEKIHIVCSSGNLVVGDFQGEGEIKNSSGNVNLGLRQISRDISVICSSGNIRLTVPRQSSYSVDLDTKSGSIKLDDTVFGAVRQERDTVEGDVNGGGPMLELYTSSGNIAVLHE